MNNRHYAGLERPIPWCDKCRHKRGRYSRKDKKTLCKECRADNRNSTREKTDMPELTAKVKIDVRLEVSEQFLGDVLTTVIESPFGEHFEWLDATRTEDLTITSAELRYENGKGLPGDPNYLDMKITLAHVAYGIQAILSGMLVNAEITGDVLRAAKEEDAGHIDSIAADAILQAAVYGEVVFG